MARTVWSWRLVARLAKVLKAFDQSTLSSEVKLIRLTERVVDEKEREKEPQSDGELRSDVIM